MPERITNLKRFCIFKDLKILEYSKAFELQNSVLQAKIKDPDLPDRVFFVQHMPVFTLGKRGGLENLVKSEKFLESKKIKIIKTDRGGNITYHGPGQAVLYPVVDIDRAKIGVADFVYGLEEIMKKTAADCNIKTGRDKKNHGLWSGKQKIGSVGISVKKGISMHGLALNVTTDMTPFSWINPCGLENLSMTSIKKQTELLNNSDMNNCPDMEWIRNRFKNYFSEIFQFSMIEEKP